ERLAHHALRGELWEKAVRYLRRAGVKAMERSAYREAVAAFAQSLGALPHLPESPARTEHAIDLHLDLGGALGGTGQWANSSEHIRKAEAFAETPGDERRLGRTLAQLAIHAWMTGDPDRAIELAQRAVVLATAHGDVTSQTWASQRLGWFWQTIGE